LHELATSNDTSAPRLILGCEEPELYQHPPQARHLAAVLQKLSKSNSQIIVSTHSPLFVSGEGFEDVRMVRKEAVSKRSNVTFMAYKDIAQAIATATGAPPTSPKGILAKIHQTLQEPMLNEMFFASKLILVEGQEDVAYITAYLHLLGKWDEYRRSGCHIVPVGAKSKLLQPLVIAKHMGIPVFIVFDADTDKPPQHHDQHKKDNKTLLTFLGKPGENPMPTATLWNTNFVMWHSDIGAIVRDDIGAHDWQLYRNKADTQYGHAGKLEKNTLHIVSSLTLAWEAGKKSSHLERLCKEILRYCQ
jgi:predicted ATP-dependent endonuclease of OLD family